VVDFETTLTTRERREGRRGSGRVGREGVWGCPVSGIPCRYTPWNVVAFMAPRVQFRNQGRYFISFFLIFIVIACTHIFILV